MIESEQRTAIVEEARQWIGSRFAMNASVRGVAADCGRLPHAVYGACGITVPDLPRHWPRDFMCNKMADSEPYLALIQQAMVEVQVPLAGDLAVFKPVRSRCFSHAAIVVQWPKVIHARGVGAHPQVESASALEWPLAGCPVRFFSAFK
jgi:cell wall-associated NlpC family hydrolase